MRDRWLAAVALLLAGAVWSVSAGSATDPEVTDRANDSRSGTGFTDIWSLWFVETSNDTMEVHLQTQLVPFTIQPLAPGAGALSYHAYFTPTRPDGQSVRPLSDDYVRSFLRLVYSPTGNTPFRFAYGHTETPGTETHVEEGTLSGRLDEDSMTWTVPLAKFSIPSGSGSVGFRLNQIFASSSTGPASQAPPVMDDRAPDTGFGRSFLFQATGATTSTTTTSTGTTTSTSATSSTTPTTTPTGQQVTDNSEGNPPSFSHYFPTPNSTTFVYSWSVDKQPVEFAYSSSRNAGTARINIHDAQGALAAEIFVDRPQDNAGRVIQDRALGEWTITIEYDGYQGGLSAAMEQYSPQTSTSPTTSTSAESETTDSTTTDGDGLKAKENNIEPAPWILGGFIILAIIVVAVLLIKRR